MTQPAISFFISLALGIAILRVRPVGRGWVRGSMTVLALASLVYATYVLAFILGVAVLFAVLSALGM